MAEHQLTTRQMAEFAARGFLRLDAVVPDAINEQFLADVGLTSDEPDSLLHHYLELMGSSVIPLVNPGTPLSDAYPQGSALSALIQLPEIAGAIQSLVGAEPTVDHHFLHVTFPTHYHRDEVVSQSTHQDSTIDPRQAFDIQLLYFPHEVTADMGGTRFVPGSQFRVVSETAISRYQNIKGQQHVVCPAGSVFIFHMGIWHGAGLNQSDSLRYMFKIRLNPQERQRCLWLQQDEPQKRPIFWTGLQQNPDDLLSVLMKNEPWFEADTGRLELINRARFWRYISGDDNFDADYWLTRIENEYAD